MCICTPYLSTFTPGVNIGHVYERIHERIHALIYVLSTLVYIYIYINQVALCLKKVLNAIESRARIADKNGKNYIQLKVTQILTFPRSSDYVGEYLYRALIKCLNMVIVVIIYGLLHEEASGDIPEIVFNVLF